jgi:hypothetical protein
MKNIFLPAGLLGLVGQVVARLPYNPTRIISTQNGTLAYVFSPQQSSSQFSLLLLDTSDSVGATSEAKILFEDLPFLSSTNSKSFTPVIDEQGLDVLAGNCQDSATGLELWRYTPDKDYKNGTWEALQLVLDDATLSSNFLAAGTSFSPSASLDDSSVYVFAGMCPNAGEHTAADWVSQATYSNTMITLSPESASDGTPYQLSMTGARAPPIAEAGLTMTPLIPSFTNSTGSVSQQQNFVLLGGHTENAFINMSQVAIFSLPQESWTFVGIDDPFPGDNTELLARDVKTVEPRSGHTAVLSEDGSKIIVFGGWVGDINTPASPQLAILDIGEGYGGVGNWRWTIPSQSTAYFGSNFGVYGHGAAMLSGGVMMVTGGHPITNLGSKLKRTTEELSFLNTTSMQWVGSYINPSSPKSPAYTAAASTSSSGLSKTVRTGLGAGLGLGIAALILVVVLWLLYQRRLRRQRSIREKELRELALGAERYVSPSSDAEASEKRYPKRRSASWHNMQERTMESSGPSGPWPLQNDEPTRTKGNNPREAERTGALMEIPSPTRGLRRSLHSRGAIGMFQPVPGGAAGSVFRIEEEEENSQSGSFKRAKTPEARDRSSVCSDPFKDPQGTADSQDPAAQERKKEVQSWVEDWQSAAESMHLSRNNSQATHGRTYSNLSQSHANSHSTNSDPSDRGSPDKSDRTGSNLSERSEYSQASLQRSTTGTLSRNLSQRSASAGYTLFAGAAAAMGRLTGGRNDQADNETNSHITRFPSNRSVSHTGVSASHTPQMRERAETFSSARTTIKPGEDEALLSRKAKNQTNDYWTPPESPVKDRDDKYHRAGSLTRTGVKAMGLLGSMKRVFSGTGTVSVQDRVAKFENRNAGSSPTKTEPEMSERYNGDPFWKHKRGARDWDHEEEGESSSAPQKSMTVRRKPLPDQVTKEPEDDDWDIETAVQRRVVQVMFTVPKEKLRVVNADALSLLSSRASDVDRDEEQEREREVKRMSSVREGDEDAGDDELNDKGKQPER